MSRKGVTVRGVESVKSSIRDVQRWLRGNPRWVVGVGVNYAVFVEFGTRYQRAQPFLGPAAQQVMRTQFSGIESSAPSLDGVVEQTARAIEAEAKARAPIDTGALRNSIEARRIR